MVKNEKKMSFAEFKAKADNTVKTEALNSIQGGNWADCHDCPTTWSKVKDYIRTAFEAPLPPVEQTCCH